MLPRAASSAVVASDSFQVPPYAVGNLAGQSAGGSGFTGSWTTDTGLTQSLAVKSSGVIGRPAVPSGSGGNYVKFASPINLNTGQLFVAYDVTNLGGTKLAATRIDLNFSTSAPFVNYRAFFGGMDPTTGHFDFELESGVCTGCGTTPVDTKIPDNDAAKHRVIGVLDAQNHKVAIFIDPTANSYYGADGSNNADAAATWIPVAGLALSSYSWIENTGDNVNFGNVVFANDAASVGLGGAPAACTYTLSPASASFGAAGGNGQISIGTSSPACAWAATSNVNWIALQGPAGTGPGTLLYAVSPNTSASPRSGALNISGATFTVTQDGACTFTLSPSSASLPAAGGSGTVAVTASAAACAWTASTTSTWIGISSGSSGTGNGSVAYQIAANSSSNPRSDSMTIAGVTFPVTQAGVSPMQIMTVANAASLTPAPAPSGGIAQGAIFSVMGSALGPGNPANAATGLSASLPLSTTLGNVSVQVTQGSTTVNAYVLFAWAGRVDAIMPSTMPPGSVAITVSYNGATSAPAAATVVTSNFGAYATNGQSGGRAVLMVQSSASDPGVQNSNTHTAIPGQYVTLIGTGLGAITGPDNLAPPTSDLPVQLQVLVGGTAATPVHAGRVANQPGRDQIQFVVPAAAPPGCNTPVQVVTAGSIYSNIVTMAIDPNGQTCSSINPWSSLADQGGKLGNIFLLRLNVTMTLEEDQPPVSIVMDQGIGDFANAPPGGGMFLSLVASIPTLGTCGGLGGSFDIGAALGGSTSVPGGQAVQYLDAGPAISVTGPNGAAQILPSVDDNGNPIIPSLYSSTLGGGLDALFGGTPPAPYLDPGTYTISGTGGTDIGPFSASLTIPSPISWTNQDAISSIDRSAGVTFAWSGGSDGQLVMLAGMASDTNSDATTGFVCFVASNPGSFTVPTPVLANLAPTGDSSLGALMFGTVPAGAGSTFTASGLDSGMAFYGSFTLKTVGVQ
jgi:uncharacterized protein (TIGR03437 family)